MQTRVRMHVRTATLGVFAITFALLFLLMDRRLNMFDEGLVLVNAVRVLHGDVIHRDFYSPYGPGSYYLLALLFHLNSHWFIVERIYGVATMAGIVALSFGLLIRRTRVAIALAFTVLCGAWMLASPYYLYPMFPSVLLALIGSSTLLGWFEQRRPAQLLLAGAATGATALFRYDAGFFLAVAHFAAVVVDVFLIADKEKRRLASAIRAGALYAAGSAIVFLPFAIVYLSVAPPSAFIADIIDYPVHYYAAMRGLPFPGPHALVRNPAAFGVYLPILTVLLALAEFAPTRSAMRVSTSQDRSDPRRDFLVVFTLLAAIFYYKGMVRVSSLHMLMSIVPSLLVLAVLVDRAWERRSTGRLVAAAILVLALAPPAFAAQQELRGAWRDTRTPLGEILASMGLTKRDVDASTCSSTPTIMLASLEPDYDRASEYIRRVTGPDEKIFVGLNRHDKIFANPVSLYFSAERPPGTHWHQFDPGLQTRSDIQADIISDLQANHVHWLIRDAHFDGWNEPNKSSQSSGVHVLDQYLEANYRPVASIGKIEIWLIDSLAAPHPELPMSCFGTDGVSAQPLTP